MDTAAGKTDSGQAPKSETEYTAKACGKFILTGEHSAVYGRSALACPLPGYETHMSIGQKQDKEWQHHLHPLVLESLKETRLDTYFHSHPEQQLFISNNVPVGIGLGASAAVVCALVRLKESVEGKKLSYEEALNLARHCEDFAHGKSSGLDVAVSLSETCIQFEAGKTTPLSDTSFMDVDDFFLINTGTSGCKTRDCVLNVGKKFNKNHKIWDKFHDIFTEIVKNGLKKDYIRENNELLHKIGVVPDKIREFIGKIEQYGGAAKISGAGSIHKDHNGAGAVLSIGLPLPELNELCEDYGYRLLPR